MKFNLPHSLAFWKTPHPKRVTLLPHTCREDPEEKKPVWQLHSSCQSGMQQHGGLLKTQKIPTDECAQGAAPQGRAPSVKPKESLARRHRMPLPAAFMLEAELSCTEVSILFNLLAGFWCCLPFWGNVSVFEMKTSFKVHTHWSPKISLRMSCYL